MPTLSSKQKFMEEKCLLGNAKCGIVKNLPLQNTVLPNATLFMLES